MIIKGTGSLGSGGRVETIPTTALLRTAKILRKVPRLEETCCLSNSSERPSAKTDVENSQRIIMIIMINAKELETLKHAVRLYSQDIGMESGIEKCAMLVMKSSKRHLTDGMELPS